MDSSGPIKILRPSMWEAKVTPSSLIFRRLGQGEHLEPAAVGEDGAVPVHELVEAAQLLDDRRRRGGGGGGRCWTARSDSRYPSGRGRTPHP